MRSPPNAGEFASGSLEETLVSLLVLVFWVGTFTFLMFVPQGIRAARSVLATERRRVVAEKDAFEAFRRRVESIVTRPSAPSGPAAVSTRQGGVLAAQQSEGSLSDLRSAYRETVMSVDHYEEDYGEPLAQHLATEFGRDVATAVTAGDGVSPGLQSALVAGVRDARASRDVLLDTIDDEDDRLSDAVTGLRTIESARSELANDPFRRVEFDDLTDRWTTLRSLDGRLDELLADQQARRRELSTSETNRNAFYEYVYQDLDTDYPVLVDGVRLARHLDDLDSRLTRALARSS